MRDGMARLDKLFSLNPESETMATKPSSLLDDGDFGNIGKGKAEQGKGKAGSPQTVKLIVVIAMFLVSAGVLAWYYWPEPPPPSARGGPGALSSEEQKAAEEQQRRVKEEMEKPETVIGDS
jgi:hypothetical protein